MKLADIKSETRIPSKLTHDPVKDVTFEIKYKSSFGEILDELVKQLYSHIKVEMSGISSPQKMQINDVPYSVRAANPALAMQPHWILLHENTIISISLNSISIAEKDSYSGWDKFHTKIKQFLGSLDKVAIFKELDKLRYGLRYISIFEGIDIFDDKIDVTLNICGVNVNKDNHYIVSNWLDSDISCTLQISNNIIVGHQSNKSSVIDIDVATPDNIDLRKLEILDSLNNFHNYEKDVFFKLLKPDFLNDLEPAFG